MIEWLNFFLLLAGSQSEDLFSGGKPLLNVVIYVPALVSRIN